MADELRLRLGLKVDVQTVPLGSLPRFEGKGKRFVDERCNSTRPTSTLTAAQFARRFARADTPAPRPGLAPGYVQANVVILPAADAADFAEFCRLNSQACPLVDRTAAGDPEPRDARRADLRSDVPRYRVFRHGLPRSGGADRNSPFVGARRFGRLSAGLLVYVREGR